jgi:hypothetical protein
MLPTLTDEQRQALADNPDGITTVVDALTHEQFVLVPVSSYERMADREEASKFQRAFEQADRGEFIECNADAIKADFRRRLAEEERQQG